MMEDERHGPPIHWPEDAHYTASYCEENVYLLVARYMAMTDGAIYVVFISNPNKSVSPTMGISRGLSLTVPHVGVGHARSPYLSPELLQTI